MTSILFLRCLMSIRCATGCQSGTYGIAFIGLVLLALFVLWFCSLVSGRAVLRWPEVGSCMGYVHYSSGTGRGALRASVNERGSERGVLQNRLELALVQNKLKFV